MIKKMNNINTILIIVFIKLKADLTKIYKKDA